MHETPVDQVIEKRIFMQIVKVDAAKREVSGLFTAEEPDLDGEILDYEGSKPLFRAWSERQVKSTMDPANPQRLSLGNVREMHNSGIAAGKLTALNFDDATKRISGTAYVSDDGSWKKCQDGTLTGFSIGGRYIGGRPVRGGKYVAMPVEISLVDKPCLPNATFAYVKSDGSTELRKFSEVAGSEIEKARPTVPSNTKKKRIVAIVGKHKDDADGPMKIESVVFEPRDSWTEKDAKKWLEDHRMKTDNRQDSETSYRFRQAPLSDFDPDSLRTILLTDNPDKMKPEKTMTDEEIQKISDSVVERLQKDHENFRMTQGGSGETQLAGPGDGRMVDVTGQANKTNNCEDTVGPRTDGAFDADEGWVQSVSLGVSKCEECPCEDCVSYRKEYESAVAVISRTFGADAIVDFEKKAEQNYATHGGTKVPRGKHAWAPPGSSPSEWKYPIDTHGRVVDAMARWGQHKGIPASEEPKVARRILAAARRFGITIDPDTKIAHDAKKVYESQVEHLPEAGKHVSVPPEGAPTMEVEKKSKGQQELEDAVKSIATAHKEYSKTMGDGLERVLKAVAHGNDPQGEPKDVDPQSALTSVGNQHDDQVPTNNDQSWAKSVDEKLSAFRSEISAEITKQFAELKAALAPKPEEKTEKGAATPGSKDAEKIVGDRTKTVDTRQAVDGNRTQLDAALKSAVGATVEKAVKDEQKIDPNQILGKDLNNLNATDAREVRAKLEDPNVRLEIMKGVRPLEGGIESLPPELNKSLSHRFANRMGR